MTAWEEGIAAAAGEQDPVDHGVRESGSRVAGDDSQRGTLLPPTRRAYLTPAKNSIPTTSQCRCVSMDVQSMYVRVRPGTRERLGSEADRHSSQAAGLQQYLRAYRCMRKRQRHP